MIFLHIHYQGFITSHYCHPIKMVDLLLTTIVTCKVSNSYFTMESCNSSNTYTNGTQDLSNATTCQNGNGFSEILFQVPIIVYISVVIQIILIITIFFGNSLVILLVARFRHLHSISNFFIACLSGADIGLSIAMIPGVVITFNPLFGASKYKCLLLWCSIMFTSSASCLTLLVVTFDRFLHITRPMLYPALMTNTKAAFLMSAVWVYAFFCAVVLPFAGVNKIYTKTFFICFEFSEVFSSKYLQFHFYINGLLPFLVMCVMYCFIAKIVLQKLKSNQIAPIPDENNKTAPSKNWFRKELKSLKTLMIILGFTGGAWLPASIIFLKQVYNPSYVPSLELRTYVSWFSYLNSAVNPIVYALRSAPFRSAAYDLLGKGRVIEFFRRQRNAASNTVSDEPRAIENIA